MMVHPFFVYIIELYLKRFRMLETELAISDALLTAEVASLVAVFALLLNPLNAFVMEVLAVALADSVAVVSSERSTLFTRLVSPLITAVVLVLFTRLLEPLTSPVANSL